MLARSRLRQVIDSQLPDAFVTLRNPLFEWEAPRAGLPSLRERMYRMALPLAVGFVILVAGSCVLGSRARDVWFFPILACVVATFLADFQYINLSVNTIGRQIDTGQWDLLRVTTLSRREILTAKVALVQIRAWQMMSLDAIVRISTVALAFGTLLLQILASGTSLAFRLSNSTILMPTYFALFAVVYMLEPLWRMRAVTSLGIAISARIHNTTFAFLAGLGVLLGMRLVQAIFLLILVNVAFPIVVFVSGWQVVLLDADLSNILVFTLVCLFWAGLVYVFYRALEVNAFRYALRFAFERE